MADAQAVSINAVIFREGRHWIAQGLQHDVCAQGDTLDEVHAAFAQQLIATAAIALELGEEPFTNIDRAPDQYWEMFGRSRITMEAESPATTQQPPYVPRMQPHYKVLDQAAA